MKADELRVKQICERSREVAQEDDRGVWADPRTLPAEAQATLRINGQKLFVLLQRIADDRDRAKAKRQGT